LVVGACIVVGSWLALGGRRDEIATAAARGQVAAPGTRTPWWVRVRSAVLLGVLSTALGVATAVGIGLVVVVLLGLLRASVG
jgi:hypothetical protein